MARFELSERARTDLDEIADYTTRHWGKAQTDQYLDLLESCMIQLAQRPLLGRQRKELAEEILSFPIESHDIFYVRTGFRISVARVLHKRQDPRRHIGREPL